MTGPAEPTDRGPADAGHAGDLVSAYVDGELGPSEAAWVARHLEACARCRTAADDARAARELLRSLPTVDGGPVVEGFLARHRAVIRTGTAFVGMAMVALGALALSSAVLHPAVVPDVDGMVAAHTATADALGGSSGSASVRPPVVDGMAPVRPVERVPGLYVAPPALAGTGLALDRWALFDGPDLTMAVYRDGAASVSVFEQPGSLLWEELPAGAVEVVGGRSVWLRDSRPAVLVSEVGDLVVTLVADDADALRAVVASLPERERGSMWDRVHDACARFTAAFAAG